MKIVFFGSGAFAMESLEVLSKSGHEVSLVVTQPDRKQGRHLLVKGTPVKESALSQNLKIFQPENINDLKSYKILQSQEADIFIVVSYGKILNRGTLDLAKKMCINIHASLLPSYRGASPIRQALINGDLETGVTFIRMNEFMDEGDIIFQKKIKIDKTDNAVSLEGKLSRLASETLCEVLVSVEKDRIEFLRQKKELATYASTLKKQDGLICWEKSAREINNHFRGCFGWPGSFTYFKGKLIKILSLEEGASGCIGKPGEVIGIGSDYIEIACSSGSVLIREVLPQSQKKMPVKSFLAGHSLRKGDCLGL